MMELLCFAVAGFLSNDDVPATLCVMIAAWQRPCFPSGDADDLLKKLREAARIAARKWKAECTYLGQPYKEHGETFYREHPRDWVVAKGEKRGRQKVVFLWRAEGREETSDLCNPPRVDNVLSQGVPTPFIIHLVRV